MPETYTRGQITHALWMFFRRGVMFTPPIQFDSRVRAFNRLGIPAYAEGRPGQGNSIRYTEYDAFEMCIALTLQDHAIKSGDAARIVQKLRPDLRVALDTIKGAQDRGDLDAYLSFRLVEITAGWGLEGQDQKQKVRPPEIASAKILTGSGAYVAELIDIAAHGVGCFVLPIGHLAFRLNAYLADAPDIRPGPRKAA